MGPWKKMMMCKTCIIIWPETVMRFIATFFAFVTLTGHAQTDAPASVPEELIVSFYANVSIPSASFKAAIDNPNGGAGVGIGMQLLFNPKGKRGSSPFYPGIDFSILPSTAINRTVAPPCPPTKPRSTITALLLRYAFCSIRKPPASRHSSMDS